MRFPDITFMTPVFQLIRDNKNSPIANMLTIIPYVMDNDQNLNYFNGIIKTDAEVRSDPSPDPFDTGVNPPGTVSQMVNATIGGFKAALITNFNNGWVNLMNFDEYSMRDYIAFAPVGPQYKDHDDVSLGMVSLTLI